MHAINSQLSALNSLIRHPIPFVSAEDQGDFFTYPPEEQEAVRMLHDAMVQIGEAKNPYAGSKAVAAKHPGRKGWSWQYLQTMYGEWKLADRDWRYLVDKKRFPEAREPEIPLAMQLFIRSKFQANQRKNRPAWRSIIRRWMQWVETGDPRHALPGYEVCPAPGKNGRHPRGLGYANCNRYAPPRAELAIARIGVHAGMDILPTIPGTRAGCRFLEYVSGDDVWLKRKCMVVGYGSLRVLQFGMMCYGASYYLDGFIQRPEVPLPSGKMERLKRRDFLWCVALMLERYGFPLDYRMHLILERGTATMSKAEARYLWEASRGQIVTCYSTMEGELVAAWDERKSGNSNAKAWHESFHNLFANEEADLPGQVGKDRDHSPAALQGRERHALALNNAAMILTPAERARLMLPFPSVEDCYAQSMERVGWINHRKEHACEGFSTVYDWRPKGMSQALPQPEGALLEYLAANPHITPATLEQHIDLFPRPETPHERMLKLSQGARFQKLPEGVWRRFYEDLHISEKIGDDGRLKFKCKQTDRTMWFRPQDPAVDGLKPGTEVTGFYRPDGTAIHLFSGGGGPGRTSEEKNSRYLLTWPAEGRLGRGEHCDPALKQDAFRRKRSALNVALGNVRAASTAEVEEARAAAANNLQVLAESGFATDETALRRDEMGSQTLAVVQGGCNGVATELAEVTAQRDAEAARAKAAARMSDRIFDSITTTPEPNQPSHEPILDPFDA